MLTAATAIYVEFFKFLNAFLPPGDRSSEVLLQWISGLQGGMAVSSLTKYIRMRCSHSATKKCCPRSVDCVRSTIGSLAWLPHRVQVLRGFLLDGNTAFRWSTAARLLRGE